MIRSDSRSARSASSLIRPCVSEISPINRALTLSPWLFDSEQIHDLQRIHPRPIHRQSPMQVWPRNTPRRSHFPEERARLYLIPNPHGNLGEMSVEGVNAQAVIHKHCIP